MLAVNPLSLLITLPNYCTLILQFGTSPLCYLIYCLLPNFIDVKHLSRFVCCIFRVMVTITIYLLHFTIKGSHIYWIYYQLLAQVLSPTTSQMDGLHPSSRSENMEVVLHIHCLLLHILSNCKSYNCLLFHTHSNCKSKTSPWGIKSLSFFFVNWRAVNCLVQELAVKLRKIVLLKRQLDDVPVQAELIQYASFIRKFCLIKCCLLLFSTVFVSYYLCCFWTCMKLS